VDFDYEMHFAKYYPIPPQQRGIPEVLTIFPREKLINIRQKGNRK
jgi:hypothetical protein